MKASDELIEFIRRHEEFVPRAYLCPSDIPTIGYGHTRGVTRRDVVRGRQITVAQAEELLADDVERAAVAVRRTIKVPLTQGQFDALVDFVFNVGEGKFNERDCTLVRKLNRGDYAGAAAEFPRWNKGRKSGKLVEMRGLTERRRKEREMFET